METDLFFIITKVSQGNTLTSYCFKICQVYVLLTSKYQLKENGFVLKDEAHNILQKLKLMQIMQMIPWILPKSNPVA